MQLIRIRLNLCESGLDAVSCYCYNKHVSCRNQIGKVLTNLTDMDFDNINQYFKLYLKTNRYAVIKSEQFN